MKNSRNTVLLLIVAILFLATTAVSAQSPDTILERRVFYQFDSTYTNPKAIDNRLAELRYHGVILWVKKPGPGKPTVMFLPGSGGSLATRARKLPWFLDRGYGLVAMSYPGMSGSKGKPSRKRIQDIANSLYRDLPNIVGDSPTILMGESLGTGVALSVAAHRVAKERAPLGVILHAPYTSLVDLVGHKRPKERVFFAHRRDLWPSKRTIKKVRTPLFIMHGGRDNIVPLSMGKRLFDLSPSKNKVLVSYPNAGHSSIWRRPTLLKMHSWIEDLY